MGYAIADSLLNDKAADYCVRLSGIRHNGGRPNQEQAMAIAIVAGIFSLLGAFLGALLSRKSDRGRWLRERRSLAAERFLSALSDSGMIHYQQKFASRTEEALAVATRFLPAEDLGRIVRLYLPEDKREEFSALTSRIVTIHISLGANPSLIGDLSAEMGRLQGLLESSLST